MKIRVLTEDEQALLQHGLAQLREHAGDRLYGQLWWPDGVRVVLVNIKEEEKDR